MDSFELNKILGAILGTCLVLMVTSFAAQAIFAPAMPAKPGFEIAVKEAAGGEKQAEAKKAVPIETLLQTASAEKGKSAATKCGACHTFEKGGPNRVGPNLYGVVNEPRGEGRGFNFSAAMKAKGGTDSDELNKFWRIEGLHPGHRDKLRRIRGQRSADVIAYPNSLSEHPRRCRPHQVMPFRSLRATVSTSTPASRPFSFAASSAWR